MSIASIISSNVIGSLDIVRVGRTYLLCGDVIFQLVFVDAIVKLTISKQESNGKLEQVEKWSYHGNNLYYVL